MARKYQNFDIEIVPDGEGYIARIRSPRGEARAPFAVPLSPQEVRILGLTVARGRHATRSVQTREVDEVKGYGNRLFDSLFTGDVLACYHESLAEVRGETGTGLRVRLRLSEAPALAQVPWEYLFDRRSGRFLALEDETPIVRYLDLPLPTGALQVEPPLRVLVMISGPSDVVGLDADEEWRRLNEALADLVSQGSVVLERLEKATLSALRWRLKAEEFHVFHFIGHGGVDAITERGVLILEDDAGRSDAVEAETIAGILSGEKTLRLAVLNACEGGRASKGDIFAGTAQCLVQQDVPAVIAMQFEISDTAAITLTHDFYKALAFGDPVDAALTEARRGLRYERRNELEWGTPVLYMRAADGRLFDVKGKPKAAPAAPAAEPEARAMQQPPRPPIHAAAQPESPPRGETAEAREERYRVRKIRELMHESQVAAFAENWTGASAKLEAVLELDPDHGEAAAQLANVRKEEQLGVLFRRGVEHDVAGRQEPAIDAFTRVRALAGRDYNGVEARIETLREKIQLQRPAKKKKSIALRVAGVVVFVIVAFSLSALNTQEQPEISASDIAAPPDGGEAPATAPEPSAARRRRGSREIAPVPRQSAGVAPSRDSEAAVLGLTRYGDPGIGALTGGMQGTHDVTLNGGVSYVIAGSCDANCGGLNLVVTEYGRVVAQDVNNTRIPNVLVTMMNTGQVQLTVHMMSCGSAECGYRLQVYQPQVKY